ncbi:MAG: hypothetical protein KAV18_03465 [Candidatus Omnitrophica bacterium]|nr:hypothetical protein [Candidatus Omnitrophota bacterium]
MKGKKILIGCSIVIGIIIILLIGTGVVVYRYYILPLTSSRLEMPEVLKTPGVLKGADFLIKELFFQDESLGDITDIVLGEFDPSPGIEIGIVGSKGALFLDEQINIKSSIVFSVRAGQVEIIDVDGDNICEYLDRGGGWQKVSLMDHKGNTIWTYGGMPGVDDICAGDIDKDGILEFIVGFNGGGGVRLLDRHAKEKWRKPDGNVWHVELIDTDNDGCLEVVHSNAGGEITVRDSQGEIISRANPPPYFSSFSICRWPGKRDREYALLSEDGMIWIFDFDGTIAAQFDAPECGSLGDARGIPVRIVSGQAEYFAVIVDFGHWERSILYIYNPAGVLVYQEVLSKASTAIAALSLGEDGEDALLVGGNGKVWTYKPKHSEE